MQEATGGRIRDPVHGYVRFTRIEQRLIDDPLAQRLRYVGQSGLAHLVFPEVRTPRFSHSLGSMHLSSRFLSASLLNTHGALKDQLEHLIEEAVLEASSNYPPKFERAIEILVGDGLQTANSVTNKMRAHVLLLEQGLRLASLVHDLGHLPFSHDFEFALDRLFERNRAEAEQRFGALLEEGDDGLAVHERIGYRLAGTLVHKIFDDVPDRDEADIARTSFRIAEEILRADPPPDAGLAVAPTPDLRVSDLWWWVHTLMSGEIDVDRCDYLLRDARNYGFEFASYDLDRLADHLVVARPRADRTLLETAVLPQGVSAVESFLLARYRAFTWGPFHHQVSKVATALRRALVTLLEPAVSGANSVPELTRFLEDLQTVASNENGDLHKRDAALLDRFRNYDDPWCMAHLRNLAAHTTDPLTGACLGLVCWRQRSLTSLWKRPDDFPVDVEAFNQSLPDRDQPANRWRQIEQELADEGVLVIRHAFEPFRTDSAQPEESIVKVSGPNGRLTPLTKVSRLTHALPEAWDHDVQVFAFELRDGDASAENVAKRLMTGKNTGE